MNRRIPIWLLFAATSLSLTACARSEPEAATENLAIESSAVSEAEPAPAYPEPSAPPERAAEANASVELPPEAAAAPDEQMLDDASATGMTARASRGEEETPGTAATGNVEE
ncbi:hypothetical protein [uncultured Sphingomonas sp.]|uniref:hypothetical protein n=1 Tax=uncultured Sphingomonas sp. TaxID=158754 RepID=UPI0035CAA370